MSAASAYRRREKLLRQLIRALQVMECELRYRLTPLPELTRLAARETGGALRDVLQLFARELDWQLSPDANSCMKAALRRTRDLPGSLRRLMLQLGRMLGRFDLSGQLQGLESVQAACQLELEALGKDRDIRLRSYQTLGFCAGAALAILFV